MNLQALRGRGNVPPPPFSSVRRLLLHPPDQRALAHLLYGALGSLVIICFKSSLRAIPTMFDYRTWLLFAGDRTRAELFAMSDGARWRGQSFAQEGRVGN